MMQSGIVAGVTSALRRGTSALVVYVFSYAAAGNGAVHSFQRTTVSEILKTPKRFDEKRIELLGRIASGFEASIFRDSTGCSTSRTLCAIWADFSRCGDCVNMVNLIEQTRQDRPNLSETPEVIVRGTIHTVRKDVRYERSVPKFTRIGFGHLSAYPAQITVEEIVVPKH